MARRRAQTAFARLHALVTHRLHDLPIPIKLLGSPIISALIIGVTTMVAVAHFIALERTNRSAEAITSSLVEAHTIQLDLTSGQAQLYRSIALRTQEVERPIIRREKDGAIGLITRADATLHDLTRADLPIDHAVLDHALAAVAAFREASLLTARFVEEDAFLAAMSTNDTQDKATAAGRALGRLVVDLSARRDAIQLRSRETYAASLYLIGGVAFVSIVLSLVVAGFFGRLIAGPVHAMTATMERLAAGDHTVDVPATTRRDEIGAMARAVEVFKRNAIEARRLAELRVQEEIQLRQAQKLEALGTLAAGIAHEINTPAQYVGDNVRFLQQSFRDAMTVMDAAASLRAAAEGEPALAAATTTLKRVESTVDLDFLRTEVPLAIAQTLDGIDRIRQIVLAVKAFSHPDGRQAASIDLNHAIETTILVSRNQWKHAAELKTDLEPDLPPVQCHAGEINQVLLNLIVNAAHAVEAKGTAPGTITVATARRDRWAEIRVSDTGTGIPADVIGRIFDPFFTTKGPGKGTGQGLTICHSIIVQKHGGTIAVDSIPGEGTTFTVRLPFEAADTRTDPRELAA